MHRHLILIIPILFTYSILLITPYTDGDQLYYREYYEALRETHILEAFSLGISYIGATEPISIFILWLGSQAGLNKDIFISLLNTLLLYLLIIFLSKNKTEKLLILLFVTNFYIIVLMTGAERLKIAYIFLLLFSLSNNRARFFLLPIAAASHFQTLILLSAQGLIAIENRIKHFFFRLTIRKSEIVLALLLIIFFGIFIFSFFNSLNSKLNAYLDATLNPTDFIQLFTLSIIGLFSTSNKLRIFLFTIAFIPFIFLIGQERVNMIAFTSIIYLLISEQKQNNPLVYILMTYFSAKSIFFISSIYSSGNGFSSI